MIGVALRISPNIPQNFHKKFNRIQLRKCDLSEYSYVNLSACFFTDLFLKVSSVFSKNHFGVAPSHLLKTLENEHLKISSKMPT